MNNRSDDARWMKQALGFALRACGLTSPNPLVGAVVCQGDESWPGWHEKAGGPHAEVNALQAAGAHACGAELYVTLEPCSTHGRTPPCTDAILAAGIRRVVIGTMDPNPSHAGRAVEILENAGVEVVTGICEEECQRLNDAFNCWIRFKRPYVLLKMAMTLDGRIATANGHSQWITGAEARGEVQRLRRWADAILVGGETVRRDDPQLLVREPANWPRQPLRLIASRSGRLGENRQVQNDGLAQTRIVSCSGADEWRKLMLKLGEEHVTSLLIEGGGDLAGELLNAGLVDRVAFFVAPKILGGADSRPVVGGPSPLSLDDAAKLTETEVTRFGDDFLITGYLTDVHRYS